jgi:hypothetical protein
MGAVNDAESVNGPEPVNDTEPANGTGPAADTDRPRPAGTGSVIPSQAAEDDPRAWGDRDEDRDAWLHDQRPPHWG